MRFRLFRSRAFWFGVPGLVFLLWAWGDSMTHAFSLNSDGSAYGVDLFHLNGDILLMWGDKRDTSRWHWEISRDEVDRGEAEEAKALLKKMSVALDIKVISVPHRWLVPAYVVGWAGLLIWRWRKFRRAFPEAPAG